MGFFDRISSVFKGKASNAVSNIEKNNPEAVYEAALTERIKQYGELKSAAAELVMLRDRTRKKLETAQRELAQVEPSVMIAVQEGEEEAALALLEQKQLLEGQITTHSRDLEDYEAKSAETTEGLRAFQVEINKLKREKTAMLARKSNAEARLDIQNSLEGISTDASHAGLNNVRESIERMNAGAELDGPAISRVSQADLAKSQARAQLAALKREMNAAKGGKPAASSDAPAGSGDAPAEPEGPDEGPTGRTL
ncbi:MAG: phage shock protein A [Myxococcota bacterium]|jgi:phage shock protein A